MPRYVLLILDDPKREWSSPDQAGAEMAELGRFPGDLAQQGKLQGGNPLEPMVETIRVRKEGGSLVMTDGPYAESKEMVGGFFPIEAASRAEAAEIANSPRASTSCAGAHAARASRSRTRCTRRRAGRKTSRSRRP